jgi:hypothetical protein
VKASFAAEYGTLPSFERRILLDINQFHPYLLLPRNYFAFFRSSQVLIPCNSAEARERAVKAIAFAKLLRKDLEVAAEFSFVTGSGPVLDRLHLTGHVQVISWPRNANVSLISSLPCSWHFPRLE